MSGGSQRLCGYRERLPVRTGSLIHLYGERRKRQLRRSELQLPKGAADFWVQVVGQDGRTVLGNFDLDNGEIIQLSGGGTFYLTVYSNRGAGNWSASYALSGGGGSGPSDRVTYTPTRQTGVSWVRGFVQLVDLCAKQLRRVPFTYPKGSVDFWVEVIGQDGRTVLGNFDLDNGEIIQLSGGGTFYLTIYSNRGAGNWTCSW